LARILIYQDKAQEVVDLIESEDNPAFAAAYTEVLGDAYQLLGRDADALAAYQQGLTDPLAEGTVDQQLVQWKALDLPEVEPEALLEPSEPESTEPESTEPESTEPESTEPESTEPEPEDVE